MKRISFVALLWLALGFLPALAKDDFLRPEQAYKYTTRFEGQRLVVDWQIEKGYYLYKDRMGATTGAPDVLFSVQWPKGEVHEDQYFGKQEIYRGQVSVPVDVSFGAARPASLALELKLQGCADAGLCYPPTKWKTTVTVPAAAAANTANTRGASWLQPVGKQDEFLPPDQAFQLTSKVKAGAATLTWVIAPNYYLYKDRIKISTSTAGYQLGALVLPKGDSKTDDYFGETEVYHEVVDVTVPVTAAPAGGGPLNLKVTYQGCAEAGLCYTPINKALDLQMDEAHP
jgi:thioredoxin:protein disulfide reductase